MGARLAGKVALITGAGRGIGAAIARLMHAEGATLLLTDCNEPAVRDVAAGLDGAVAYVQDVTQERAWNEVAALVEATQGRLDVLVNNAGIEVSKPIGEMSLDEWRRVMAVNVDGAFLGCRAMLPMLRAAGRIRPAGASVIHFGSVAGLIGFPDQVGYNASKAATRHLARSLAIEWGHHGYNIRVNTVHPGPTRTHIVEQYVAAEVARGRVEAAVWNEIVAYSPLGRIGRVEDIAWGAVYLASDEAANVNATDLVIDGGMVAQ
ncbi:MAG: SDR family NAD(P)-dependent oxidoreductase [Dehalococcoidia bacterium]